MLKSLAKVFYVAGIIIFILSAKLTNWFDFMVTKQFHPLDKTFDGLIFITSMAVV